MRDDFEKNRQDDNEFTSGSLDFYNDEISRKAVGRLFEEIEDEEAASLENIERTYRVESPRRSSSKEPINNYFYEEDRAFEESETEGIVRGFKREDEYDRRPKRDNIHHDEFRYEREEPKRPLSSTSRLREVREEIRNREEKVNPREERDKYRKQFLDDINEEHDARRSEFRRDRERIPFERVARPERIERAERPERIERAERVERPEKKERAERPERIERRIPDSRQPIRHRRIEQEQEELNNAERRYSRRAEEEFEPKIQKAKPGQPPRTRRQPLYQENSSAKADVFAMPIFKIGGIVLLVVSLIIIFMSVQINSLSKQVRELKEFESTNTELRAMLTVKDEEIERLTERETLRTEEIHNLTLLVQSLTGENIENGLRDESEEVENTDLVVSGSYTVVKGDTLNGLGLKFFGSASQGAQRIREANNLTSDALREGQVLIIPE